MAQLLEKAMQERDDPAMTVSRLRTLRVRGYAHLTPFVIRRKE
jgi:hypothetical protein